MRILIVEDSPLVQQMYGLAFSRREHELTTASDGRAALAQLADPASRFDVILLDLRMPGMNGVEFLREVRRDARLAHLGRVACPTWLGLPVLAAKILETYGLLGRIEVGRAHPRPPRSAAMSGRGSWRSSASRAGGGWPPP